MTMTMTCVRVVATSWDEARTSGAECSKDAACHCEPEAPLTLFCLIHSSIASHIAHLASRGRADLPLCPSVALTTLSQVRNSLRCDLSGSPLSANGERRYRGQIFCAQIRLISVESTVETARNWELGAIGGESVSWSLLGENRRAAVTMPTVRIQAASAVSTDHRRQSWPVFGKAENLATN